MRTLLILSVLSQFILGCAKKESDDLAKAQNCLNKVSESRPSDADACMQFVAKYSSQQANILKCSIKITSGGLMESKIVKGYNILEDDSQTNKEASFMAVLSLDNPNFTEGLAKAKAASAFCLESGVNGLIYLSNIVLAGTALAKTMEDAGLSDFDPADPDSVNNAIEGLLTACAVATPPANCTENIDSMGAAVEILGESYCAGESADAGVCTQIQDTLKASSGDAAKTGQALLCVLAKKQYNPSTNGCD